MKFSQIAYQQPAPEFYPGDRVKWLENGVIYTVTGGTHTHTQVEGVEYAVANWELKLSYRKRKRKSSVVSDTALVSENERSLRVSPDPTGDRNCLRSPGEVFPTAGEGLIGRTPTACDLSHFLASLTVLRFRGTVATSIFDKFQENCFPSVFKMP